MQKRPKYYQNRLEPLKIIETLNLNFNISNVIKYLFRSKNKNKIEDLKKALDYLDNERLKKSAIVESIMKNWSDENIDKDLKKALVSYLSPTNEIILMDSIIRYIEKIKKG
jgi:hypothetical protein